MMRFEPTLILTRLVIDRNGTAVYDEYFHEGVNVIRGENSSGKSTILNFIFYGLGGDLTDWSEHALLCSRVFLETRLNGKQATLSREVSQHHGQPMEIFGGSYGDAVAAPRAAWMRYPYRRSPSQESFSQALFRLLGIPEVANEVSGNLTIHQVLRLLYADQLSPVEEIFRHETRYDSPALRDSIGRLLCGAYEGSLYDNEIRIRDLTTEFDSKNAELRSLLTVVGKTEQNVATGWVEGERRYLEEERQRLQKEIELAEAEFFASKSDDQLTLKVQDEAYKEVQRLQVERGTAQQERDSLLLTMADSGAFIGSLEAKITALNDSSLVAQHLGDVRFTTCPACFAPLGESHNAEGHACHLCKTPFESERAQSRLVAMINEAAIQLKQSRVLQSGREERLQTLNDRLERLEREWQHASERLRSAQRLPSTEARERLRALHRQSGYLDRQLEDLQNKARLLEMINQLAARKDELNDAITRLRSENDRVRALHQQRLSRAYTLISEQVRTLLHNDLRRQDSFETAQAIEFGFGGNKLRVDSHSYFSASSRVILKSSFFIGFLAAAVKADFFRHPRFCMIDTIEDKGMEPERSHNFQNEILRVSEQAPVEHQVIYATAMISPLLDEESYTVGKFSTRDNPTLNIWS